MFPDGMSRGCSFRTAFRQKRCSRVATGVRAAPLDVTRETPHVRKTRKESAEVTDGRYTSLATFLRDSQFCRRNFLHRRGRSTCSGKGSGQSMFCARAIISRNSAVTYSSEVLPGVYGWQRPALLRILRCTGGQEGHDFESCITTASLK